MNLYRRLLLAALFDTLTPWRVWLAFWRLGWRRPTINRSWMATRNTYRALRCAWRFAQQYRTVNHG